jgi:hypothetical protein
MDQLQAVPVVNALLHNVADLAKHRQMLSELSVVKSGELKVREMNSLPIRRTAHMVE